MHEFEPTVIIFFWIEEYHARPAQIKNKSPNLWQVTNILVSCIFDRSYQEPVESKHQVLTNFKYENLPRDKFKNFMNLREFVVF